MIKQETFDITAFFDAELAQHGEALNRVRQGLLEPFARLVSVAEASLRSGGKIVFFGNGGSAADAQHLATELTVRYTSNRVPIAAIALSTDTSALTAIGNDMGFDLVFARQLQAVGCPGDIALGITTSGRSRNVVLALQVARELGVVPAGLTGGDGGDLTGIADPLLVVPSRVTARIQEMHITLGHLLCGALEKTLGLV
jgi:D-sedoheptulose 7-phosphate isomerase